MALYLLHYCYDDLVGGGPYNLSTVNNPPSLVQRHGRMPMQFTGTLDYLSDVTQVEDWLLAQLIAGNITVSNVQLLGWQLLADEQRPGV